jgi:hypothetical protein
VESNQLRRDSGKIKYWYINFDIYVASETGKYAIKYMVISIFERKKWRYIQSSREFAKPSTDPQPRVFAQLVECSFFIQSGNSPLNSQYNIDLTMNAWSKQEWTVNIVRLGGNF